MSMKVRFRLEECLCGGVTVDIEDIIWHFAKRESADRFLVSRGFEQEDEVTDLERLVKADFEANPPYEWEKAMGGVRGPESVSCCEVETISDERSRRRKW